MAGTSIGTGYANFTGLRVSVAPTYIPAYQKNGQDVSACCKIRAFVNTKRDRADVYEFTAWGKMADICAKSLSIGKEFNALCRTESYEGRVWNGGNLVVKADGTPLTVRKTSFVIMDPVFGAESNKLITEEIQLGKRPADWNVEGSQGQQIWRQKMANRKALVYDGTSESFGYAKVVKANTSAVAPLAAQVAEAANNAAVASAFGGVQAMTNAQGSLF